MFRKILIANRGEIACRIAKACRQLGIKTVAVYSRADENSAHVRAADHAICIGPGQSSHSYLNMENILQVAIQEECQAIHPGYGFLSQNSLFSLMCDQYKVTFIGPRGNVMKKMGDKVEARKTMSQAGLPIIPGSKGLIKDIRSEAEKIGYPLLMKATAGGGGKGMRICRRPEDLEQSFLEASLEAEKAFGNAGIYLEKFIEVGRHIEFQVLADSYGNVVHLGERECSIQRNYQKLIEESPSPAMTAELRKRMGEMVTTAMKQVNYLNAGTLEFLFDNSNGNLYFMEMNTRLQVEHPVSEMVTGFDIVQEQIRIAANHQLSISQEKVKMTGHALECRINAEDTDNNFRPCPGKITRFVAPTTTLDGATMRLDTYVEEGAVIPPFYDSMIGKLIIHSPSRAESIAAMQHALKSFVIEGVKTTIPLHLQILDSPEFRSGNYNTKFMEHFRGR